MTAPQNGLSLYGHPYFHQTPVVAPQPAPKPPSLWEVYSKLKEPEPPSQVQSAVTGIRHNAEGGLIGALLGLAHGEFGSLDLGGKYPVDGIAALLLFAMSVRDAGKPEGLASDFRAGSQACTSVFTYRKAKEWREGKKATSESNQAPARMSAKVTVDPIAEAAKRLLKEEK